MEVPIAGSSRSLALRVTLLATLTEHTKPVTQILVLPSEVHQFCFLSSSKDSYIIVWIQSRSSADDLGPWEVCKKWGIGDPFKMCHFKGVTDLSHSSKAANKFASSSLDKSVIVWDLHTGNIQEKINIAHQSGVLSVALSKDGNRMCTGSQDRSVKVWDSRCRCKVHPLTFKNAHSDFVTHVRLNPVEESGNMISCGGAEINLWDIRRHPKKYGGDLSKRWEKPNCIYLKRTAEYGNDGLHLVTGGNSEIVNVWKFREPLNQSQILKTFRMEKGSSLSSAKFSPDLSFMAAAMGNSVFIFDMKTLQQVARVLVDMNPEVEATIVEWFFNEKRLWLFVGMSNGTIKIFQCSVQGRAVFEPMCID